MTTNRLSIHQEQRGNFALQDQPNMKPNKDVKQLAERVKHFREKKGWSQAELANRMGRDKQWIQRVENGTTNIRYTSLCAIAKCLGVSIKKLTDK